MKNNKGFTLLEVLISIVIIVILGVVFFQFFVISQKAASSNEGKLGAVNLAQAVLEQVKNGEYQEIIDDCKAAGFPKTYSNSGESGSPVCDRYGKAEEKSACNSRYEKKVNKDTLFIEIDVDSEIEAGLGLHSVVVKVLDNAGKIKANVRGAVEICPGDS